jgi:hypothetical protein
LSVSSEININTSILREYFDSSRLLTATILAFYLSLQTRIEKILGDKKHQALLESVLFSRYIYIRTFTIEI